MRRTSKSSRVTVTESGRSAAPAAAAGAAPSRPQCLTDVEACVEAILDRVGRDLKVALPLGLGKPPELVNALYRRAKADPTIRLTILTALTLERPAPGKGLEAAFMGPILDRIFDGVVELDYANDVSAKQLPANVRVIEFYFRPGSRLGNAQAQRDYISTNYTFAARDIAELGCNVALQWIARRDTADGLRYSLSCNPDTTIELARRLRALEASGSRRIALVGVVNPKLPYFAHDAEVLPEAFDLVVDHPRYASALFSTPKQPVTMPDYAIGLQAAALVADGGTLQIGIGALGDAIVHALKLRHASNTAYRGLLKALGVPARSGALIERVGGTAKFEQGLYGATEMFVDGFWQLIRAGILTRRVHDHWALQTLIDSGRHDPDAAPTLATLDALAALGVHALGPDDVAALVRHGLFRDGTRWDRGWLLAADGSRVSPVLADPDARHAIARHLLADTPLRGGIVLHGGFFLGPRDFYRGLSKMSQAERDRIVMTGVERINQLDHDRRLYGVQRRRARFINTGMMATLNGAVVSDGLADGRVVSGVGGQYNFVAMAHQLPDARSILMIRAVRQPDDGGEATSNIVFSYGHTTIARHLRDLLITEYGIADLRGQTDSEVAKRLLNIADSRFQPALLAELKAHGRVEADYEIPAQHRDNTPEALAAKLAPHAARLPAFPFGSDLTPEELRLGAALKAVKARAASLSKLQLGLLALRPVGEVDEALRPHLQRLGLLAPQSIEDRVARALLIEALEAYQP